MLCYNCGCHLSEHDFCTACGADVSVYKKIICYSNMFYNQGLERARVRDLSGAINSLRQSLKFNKNNIEARNLLGLVYFEMGEVVLALREWVISKNLRSDKNIADDYIGMIQANATRLDTINQTIKKYNQAYAYCLQDSKDLAIIQLKKVLSLNPKFIRAHLLLALLYIDSERWELAKREIQKCLKIDRNNTTSLRYLQEIEYMMVPEEQERKGGKGKKEEMIRYQSDNEMIIQPINVKEAKSGSFVTILNILIGLIVGAAAVYFLAVPEVMTKSQQRIQEETAKYGNQLDAKTVEIQSLQSEINGLQKENDMLQGDLDKIIGTGGTMNTIDQLLEAATIYITSQDMELTATNLEEVSKRMGYQDTSQSFQELYDALLTTIGPSLAKKYHEEGYVLMRNEEFDAAIEKLKMAVLYDSQNPEILFDLANACRRAEDTVNAAAYFEQVMEKFPDTQWARRAKEYRDGLQDVP